MSKKIQILKKYFFPSLFLLIYISLCITVFFGSSDITEIGTTIGLQILLIILGLLALHQTKIQYKNILFLSFTIAGAILGLIARRALSFQHAIFLFCTHAVFVIYIWNRFFLINSSKKIYLWTYAHQGLSDIAFILAITYTATLRSASSEITINCNELHNQTLGLVTHYIPNIQNNNQFNLILQKIDTIGSQSIGQILGAQSQSSGQNIVLDYTGTNNTTQDGHSGLLLSVLSYQKGLINGVLNNQELIDAQVCDMTLQQINTISKKNDIKLIAFVLLVLLLSFFMKSIMFIVGIINFVLLQILFKCKRFNKEKIQGTIEKITL